MAILRRIENFIVHHSLTKDGETVSWNAIRNYHVNDLGWSDIGYHWGIELIGDHYEVLMGRPMGVVGAHCRSGGMNHKSIGVVVVGNFDKTIVPAGAWTLTKTLLTNLLRMTGLHPSDILGHREAGFIDGYDWTKGEFKSCPGKNFLMDLLRQEIESQKEWNIPLWR